MVECPIISFFTDFDGYVTYGAFSNYLYKNYGDYITLRDDGTFGLYDDGNMLYTSLLIQMLKYLLQRSSVTEI